jgi:hypothetical protein
MSRRQRLHRQRGGFPWLFVIVGGVLVLVAAVVLANQGGGRNGGETAGGRPQIAVDQQKIDYGYVKFGNDRQFTIKVTNGGDGTLRFTQKPYVEVLEGC